MPYNPINGPIGELFPPGGSAPKPPMGQAPPQAGAPMMPGPDPQRMALLQALAAKIGRGNV